MKYFATIFSIASFFSLYITKPVFPQAGQLDQNFGSNGIVNTGFYLERDCFLFSSAIQSDGKIVAAGDAYLQNHSHFAIARYNTNGSLDDSFGINGMVITSINSAYYDEASSVAIQNDGKIIAAGDYYNGSDEDFAVIRYNSDGSLDNTFGNDGIVTFGFGAASDDYVYSVGIQTDGKIVVAGYSYNGLDNYFALARLQSNGFFDNTFGNNGKVTTLSGAFDEIFSIAIQTDGKIIAGGNSDNNFTLLRYNQNGSLDNSFGTNGIVSTLTGSSSFCSSVITQTDGKIIAAGESDINTVGEFTLVKYNPDGSLDTTFGSGGIVTTSIGGSYDAIYSIKQQNNGKITAAGSVFFLGNDQFGVARYNSDGTLDNSFGTEGVVLKPIGSSAAEAYSLIIENGGEVIASGVSYDNNGYQEFTLAGFNSNGTPDLNFGSGGIEITHVGTSNAAANSVSLENDGKIVAAGYAWNGSNSDFALSRYNSNGSPDSSFGTNGKVLIPIGTSNDYAYSVAIQNDNKIVAAGYYLNANNYNNFALIRCKQDGTLDSTFGTNGIVTASLGFDVDSKGRSVVIQNDGKIIIAGSANPSIYDNFVMIRYKSNGSLDSSFGYNGVVITQTGPSSIDEAYQVKLQQDGKIILIGSSDIGIYFNFSLVRYNTNGNIDSTFGTDGIVTTQIGTSDADAFSAKIQPDGKFILAGTSTIGNGYGFTLVRYNPDGSLDNGFGTGGIVMTQIGNSGDAANDVALQNDGKIVAGGYHTEGTNSIFALIRYNSNGTPDNTFGTNGIVTTSSILPYNAITSLSISGDGNIIAAGSSSGGTDFGVFTFAKYLSSPASGVNQDNKSKSPAAFKLFQNYPNPFNPSTKIEFRISNFGLVSLNVYDILGRKVATLVNENKQAGNYEITFNASSLSSGVYFYRLRAGSFVETKKMILLR